MRGSKLEKSRRHSIERHHKDRDFGETHRKSDIKKTHRREIEEIRRKYDDKSSDRKKHKEIRYQQGSPSLESLNQHRSDLRKNVDRSFHLNKDDHRKQSSSLERRKDPPRSRRVHDDQSFEERKKGSSEGRNHHRDGHREEDAHRNDDHQRKSKARPKDSGNESYEELSKKKQRIESELQALEMEEAAKEQAESSTSTANRHTSQHHKRKKSPGVVIKQEPMSDEDTRHGRTPEEEPRQKRRHFPSRTQEEENWGRTSETEKKNEKPKEKPNFAVSGRLAEDTNTFNGVVIKYNEPPEARKPKRKWRLYPFKGDSSLPFLPIHRQSAYLFGRTRLIADIPIDHPSCSKQHAVLQFRLVGYQREDGTKGKRVRPYVIDLESSNGTFVNNKRIDPRRYVELIEKDVVKFGFSSREYVVLHEESKNDEEDDDVNDIPEENND